MKRVQVLNSGREVETTLYTSEEFRVVFIESFEAKTDMMYQPVDEFVTIIQGWALLEVGADQHRLEVNDSFYIQKNTHHRVLMTSADCCWICVYYLTLQTI